MTLHLIPTRFGEELRNPEFNKGLRTSECCEHDFFCFFLPCMVIIRNDAGVKGQEGKWLQAQHRADSNSGPFPGYHPAANGDRLSLLVSFFLSGGGKQVKHKHICVCVCESGSD